MNYYIGIRGSKNEIIFFHIINKRKKTIYFGQEKIKEKFVIFDHDEFKMEISLYDLLIPIKKENFNKFLELNFFTLSKLQIIQFLKQYSLEEYII